MHTYGKQKKERPVIREEKASSVLKAPLYPSTDITQMYTNKLTQFKDKVLQYFANLGFIEIDQALVKRTIAARINQITVTDIQLQQLS